MVEEVAATERVKVSLSAPKSMVLLETAPLKTMLSPPEPPMEAAVDGAGEQEKVRSSVSKTQAPLLTPAEKLSVSLPDPPNTDPVERSPPKETESLPAPPVNQRSCLQV